MMSQVFFLFALLIGYSLACTEDDACGICGSSASYEETISNGARVITTSGCPHHYSICTGKGTTDGCGADYTEGTLSEATEQCETYTIPARPQFRDGYLDDDIYSVACQMGAIGVALNGVPFFSGAVDTDCTLLDVDDDSSEWMSFDMCGGHSTTAGKYHYHFVPSCLVTDAEARNDSGITTGHSAQIGWAFDGFPVYGPLYTGGVDASLYTDDCGGIKEALSDVDDFLYRYYVTGPTSDLYSLPHDTPSSDQFPYTFDCYAGYTFKEIGEGASGDDGYSSSYVAEAMTGYTTSFSSYGLSGNITSCFLDDGECSSSTLC